MKLVSTVWSSNQYCDGGCEFAFVGLTVELAKVTLRRIHTLKEHMKNDEPVFETYYCAYYANYFSPWAHVNSVPGNVKTALQAMAEIVEVLGVEEQDIVTAPDDFQAVEQQVAAVECKQMVVREDGIAFLAIPKLCDFYVTTADIPLSLLEQAAGINRAEMYQKPTA